jgi:hypothetical protein
MIKPLRNRKRLPIAETVTAHTHSAKVSQPLRVHAVQGYIIVCFGPNEGLGDFECMTLNGESVIVHQVLPGTCTILIFHPFKLTEISIMLSVIFEHFLVHVQCVSMHCLAIGSPGTAKWRSKGIGD